MYVMKVINLDDNKFYICKVTSARDGFDPARPVDPKNKFGDHRLANEMLRPCGGEDMLNAVYDKYVEEYDGHEFFINVDAKKKSTGTSKKSKKKNTSSSSGKSKKVSSSKKKKGDE